MASTTYATLIQCLGQPYLSYLVLQYWGIPGPLDLNSNPELIRVHLEIMSKSQQRKALKTGLHQDHLAVVQLLLTKFKIKLTSRSLDLACRQNSIQVVQWLGSRFSDRHLTMACEANQIIMVQALLDTGLVPDSSHLAIACYLESLDLIRKLPPKVQLNLPLSHYYLGHDLKILGYLCCEMQVPVNLGYWRSLCQSPNSAVLDFLLNEIKLVISEPMLDFVCRLSPVSMAQQLRVAGADFRNSKYLDTACRHGSAEMIRFLVTEVGLVLQQAQLNLVYRFRDPSVVELVVGLAPGLKLTLDPMPLPEMYLR